MKIKAYEILLAQIQLREPYVLSFATIRRIDSIVLRLHLDNGCSGFSEVVPLPGYSHETTDSILQDLKQIMPSTLGLDTGELPGLLSSRVSESPFTVSLITTAKEVAAGELDFPDSLEVPLLAPVSAAMDTGPVLTKTNAFIHKGYGTIKLKVGRDVEADKKTIKVLLDEIPDGVKIRIDANQAYSLQQAEEIIKTIEDHPRHHIVELFEQPFGTEEKDWLTFSQLARKTSAVPLMLDESIIQNHHVDRAAEAGASFVKLKLFKQAGVNGLWELATHARDLGLKVVLGNGVSTEIGNILEAVAYAGSNLFTGASEGNGFEKLSRRLIQPEVHVESGVMKWKGGNFNDSLREEYFSLIFKQGC